MKFPGDTAEKEQDSITAFRTSVFRMLIFIINFLSGNLSWFIIYVTLTVNYINNTGRWNIKEITFI